MRLGFSLNKISVGLAVISFLSAGAASAQTLTGANATLDRSLETKTATVGQVITAKLNGAVKTESGVDLPRGTELLGKVAETKASANGGPASLTIAFTTAKLKGGKEIPVKVTLLAAARPGEGDTSIGEAPATVSNEASVSQSPGALSKVSLVSAVKNPTSGTFTRTDGNFKLDAGTFFQVAIAPAGTAGATNAAE